MGYSNIVPRPCLLVTKLTSSNAASPSLASPPLPFPSLPFPCLSQVLRELGVFQEADIAVAVDALHSAVAALNEEVGEGMGGEGENERKSE